MSSRRANDPLPRPSGPRRPRGLVAAFTVAIALVIGVLGTGVLPPPTPPPAPVVDARLTTRLAVSGFTVIEDGAISASLAERARAVVADSVRPATVPYAIGLVRFSAPGPEGGTPIVDAEAILARIAAPAGTQFDIGNTKASEIALFIDRVTIVPIVAVSLDALPPPPSPSVSPNPSASPDPSVSPTP
jgi:hypothetical protein